MEGDATNGDIIEERAAIQYQAEDRGAIDNIEDQAGDRAAIQGPAKYTVSRDRPVANEVVGNDASDR